MNKVMTLTNIIDEEKSLNNYFPGLSKRTAIY